ncbi:choline BCCT transporter BetT [Corynebacterium rhinophilum]|uniref:choline BCCT transporter BetT n=1 Tax=Corynebacterium rhinophilum TaxID=3050197 RepID=UPI00254ED7F6|nr:MULTISPECIES: choline BCCT transporter BetT [unclassified Corynebacterium]MDK8453268.1 choline BCCT transporter BetT [Corynebacterium sp. MSK084]MDK8515198.1 choline BCCT transporter BetT [Corynebacterium sp. MSK123]MDK8548424.1 choline BCCT transporter BetT [Corynebacterium sp. MSK222]MDK8703107.1 choline BCCT transporter BetT [Corynebacterium sp. MSK107]MDK8704780.1 choline BCCT transporter BetT [Corynebacterium sp. MSK090]
MANRGPHDHEESRTGDSDTSLAHSPGETHPTEDKGHKPRNQVRAIVGSYKAETGDDVGADEVAAPKPNWPVFIISGVLIIAMALYAGFGKESAANTLASVTGWIGTNLGWFYVLTATIAVVFVLYIAFSNTGSIRMGPDHSRPKFNTFSWVSMLFAAGIGVDLMFFAVAEPVTMYMDPPVGDGETMEAAKEAVVYAMFHYGLTGWALYALMGMAFGYFAYRLNMPLAIRSALYPLIGKRVHGPIGSAVDIAAMLGTVFGVTASLGIGVVQLSYGFHLIFGIEQGLGLQSALIIVAVVIATLSAVSGVDKGIRFLSELNVYLAIALMVYVVVFGKTAYLFDAIVTNIGDYVSKFPSWTLETFAFAEDQASVDTWMQSWTLFFWAWWIAWATFVGLFLARISRGRTLRQFILGTLTFPFLFILMWMSFFGNTALDMVRSGDYPEFAENAINVPEQGFYDMLQEFPGSAIVIFLTTFIGLLLYITSADSGALVMSNFTSRITDNRQDGARWLRIFWSITVGALTLALLQLDGIATVQSATVVMGLPFAFVVYLIMFSLWKSLRLEIVQREARKTALHGAISSRTEREPSDSNLWKNRLDRANSFPTKQDMDDYLRGTAAYALEQVATQMRTRGYDAILLTSELPDAELPQLDLEVRLHNERQFRYQLFPVSAERPDFCEGDGEYYRLEVYDMTGSLGYDVYGYSENQIINNVLDLYERHLAFLYMQQSQPGDSDVSDGAEPERTWREDS